MIARAALGAALLIAGLTACGSTTLAHTCGTDTIPPVAAEPASCDPATPGFRWYSAPAYDVSEPDEQPVVGQPLDGDWWDPAEQADTDDIHKAPAKPRTTSAPAKPTTTRTPRR